MNLAETKNKSTTNGWMVVLIAFTLAALSPEYVAPFFTVVGAIYTMRNKQIGKKSLDAFSIGYMLIAFICWMVVGVFYANSIISALASVGLWLLMLSGMWMCTEWIDTPEKMEKVIYGGAFASGINGFIGIFQAFTRNYAPEVEKMVNPSFWRFIDLLAEKIFQIVVQYIPFEFQRTTFKVFPTRSCGTFSNPLFYATFQVAMIPFAAYCFLNCKKRSHRILGLISLLLSLGGLAFSYSRGPYIVAAVVLMMLLVYGGKKALKIMGLGAAGCVAIFAVFGNVISRLLTLGSKTDTSINLRKQILAAVFEKIPERFVFGYGTGFDSVRSILHNEYKVKQPHAHNIILEIHMENGFIGVVLFLAVCLVFLYNILRLYKKGDKARFFAITLFTSYMGMCMCGMTDCIFYGLKPLQYFMMILGLTQACVGIYLKDEKLFSIKKRELSQNKE